MCLPCLQAHRMPAFQVENSGSSAIFSLCARFLQLLVNFSCSWPIELLQPFVRYPGVVQGLGCVSAPSLPIVLGGQRVDPFLFLFSFPSTLGTLARLRQQKQQPLDNA